MNNEIKEILSYLKKKENTRRIKCITIEESKQLLDYITNLRQDNKELLKKSYSDDVKITKAIEFIKEKARNNCWIDQYEASDLLNILQNGSDDNER